MGIRNFWSIVESSGRNISIENLRGKRLAVDIYIWLNQIVRAARTETGEEVPNAHIYIVVLRLCKLLFYGIKPVIVFDGAAPALKKRTIAARREKSQVAAQQMAAIHADLLLTERAERLSQGVNTLLFVHPRFLNLVFRNNRTMTNYHLLESLQSLNSN